jgi:hypothetical protein
MITSLATINHKAKFCTSGVALLLLLQCSGSIYSIISPSKSFMPRKKLPLRLWHYTTNPWASTFSPYTNPYLSISLFQEIFHFSISIGYEISMKLLTNKKQ